MTDIGKGKAAGGGGVTDKLDESDVLNLVLDYLATKGFVEAEQTLRHSLSASEGSREAPKSNQGSGANTDTTAVGGKWRSSIVVTAESRKLLKFSSIQTKYRYSRRRMYVYFTNLHEPRALYGNSRSFWKVYRVDAKVVKARNCTPCPSDGAACVKI